MSLADRVRQDAERVRQSAKYEPITILVWGPGDPGPRASAERRRSYKSEYRLRIS